MIAKNLEAPLTEAEERPIDRALMQGTWEMTCMSYKELSEHYRTVAESLQRRLDDVTNDNIVLRRRLDEKNELIERIYRGARNED